MPAAFSGNMGYELTYVSVVGGTASVLGGGKFGNGAVTAAFGYLYNHLMHQDGAELSTNEVTPQTDDTQEPILLAANTHCIGRGVATVCAGGGGGGGGGAISVTRSGVALPAAPKYTIPPNYVSNPNRSGSYGEYVNGKFVERLRIDPPTPPGMKGPNYSHYHLNDGKQHYRPGGHIIDPGFNGSIIPK